MTDVKIELIPETHGRTDRRLGRHKVHDLRSLHYAHGVIPHSAIKSVEWTRRIPILDQSDLHAQGIKTPIDADALGSCTANAATGWAGTDNIWRQGLTEVAGAPLDEAWAIKFYEVETKIDGIPGQYPPDDCGSSGLAAGKTLRKDGLCSSYLHAFSLHAVESALQNGPVLFGFPWYESMFDADADGNLTISGDVVGGHEICGVGLDVESKKVKIANSWGPTFGQDGYFYLTYDQLFELLDQGGDCVAPVIKA